MYYIAFEHENSKQKRWKVLGNKQAVFEYFKLPDDTKIDNVNEVIGDKWEVAKLTTPTRKKLEKHFSKAAVVLEGKGQYLPDLINSL